MPRFLKDGIPAFLAIIVFLLAEVLSTLRPVSLNYELISNIVMLAIAVGGFFIVGLPSKQRTSNLSCVLSNLFVSIIAFPMNIDVFGHTIHWDNLLADLYWHFGWIICAAIQLLFLTKLGESLLKQAVALLTWTQDKILAFGDSVRSIIDLLKRQDKGIVAIMGSAAAAYAVYLGYRIYFEGIQTVFSDSNTLWAGVCLWITCMIIGCLAYMIPSVCRQSKAAILKLDCKTILVALLTVAGLCVLFYSLPLVAGLMGTILAALVSLGCGVYVAIKLAAKRSRQQASQIPSGTNSPERNGQSQSGSALETPTNSAARSTSSVNPLDLVIALLAFVVIPLVLIFIVTACSGEGSAILENDTANFTTWLNFIEAALNVASELLQLFA